MTSYNKHKNEHKTSKWAIASMLMAADYKLVLLEHKRCDVTAFARVGNNRFVLSVEVERSVKNVMNNVTRNITADCDHVLIVCSNQKVMQQVSKRLKKHLPESFLKKTSITTRESLCVEDLRRIKELAS